MIFAEWGFNGCLGGRAQSSLIRYDQCRRVAINHSGYCSSPRPASIRETRQPQSAAFACLPRDGRERLGSAGLPAASCHGASTGAGRWVRLQTTVASPRAYHWSWKAYAGPPEPDRLYESTAAGARWLVCGSTAPGDGRFVGVVCAVHLLKCTFVGRDDK